VDISAAVESRVTNPLHADIGWPARSTVLAATSMQQSIALNLPYDLTDAEWTKVVAVYRAMGDWIEGQDIPCWFGPLNSSRLSAVKQLCITLLNNAAASGGM
jgi:hypothetical protein